MQQRHPICQTTTLFLLSLRIQGVWGEICIWQKSSRVYVKRHLICQPNTNNRNAASRDTEFVNQPPYFSSLYLASGFGEKISSKGLTGLQQKTPSLLANHTIGLQQECMQQKHPICQPTTYLGDSSISLVGLQYCQQETFDLSTNHLCPPSYAARHTYLWMDTSREEGSSNDLVGTEDEAAILKMVANPAS